MFDSGVLSVLDHLNFDGDDHRDQLLIQLPHDHQLLQRQAAQPADTQKIDVHKHQRPDPPTANLTRFY